MKRLTANIILLLLLHNVLQAQSVTVQGSTKGDGIYTTLATAFNAINLFPQTGNNILVSVTVGTSETSTATLNAGTWASLEIFPSTAGAVVRGSMNGPLINLNGADNVIIDGRLNRTGTSSDLTITNLYAGPLGASTVQFDNSANNNTVRYCNIKGAGVGIGPNTRGTIYFSAAIGGNSFNTIENNLITSASTGRAVNSIYSTGQNINNQNASNNILNNSFADFLNGGMASYGIYLGAYNSGWSITGNSFFETADFVPSSGASFQAVHIESGEGNIISGNYIGGSAPSGEGTWYKTGSLNNPFTAIAVNGDAASTAEIQGNIIRNITWINPGASTWTGILASGGNISIGTKEGNIIGSSTGNGSLALSSSVGSSQIYGINISSPGAVDCRNNIIGSIAGKSTEKGAITIYAINIGSSAGKALISDNLIGSETSPESIISAGPASVLAQGVYGIASSASGIAAITGNRIANLTNATTNEYTGTTGVINGITITNGTAKISGNSIHDLTIANANNTSLNQASACGIVIASALVKSVTGNTIYNISNSYPSFAGSVFGIYFTGSNTADANIASQNFIRNLSVTGASSIGSSISGIAIATGSCTLSNNIVFLGVNTPSSVYGIHETAAKKDSNSFLFNTVYIDGNPGSGKSQSAALYSSGEGSTRIIRNNIFCNLRSAGDGFHLNYAAWFGYPEAAELTLSHNDYFAPGEGSFLGYAGGTIISELPFFTGSDAGSLTADPVFSTPGSPVATDYIPLASLNGFPGTGITDDYSAAVRAAIPTIGAFERGAFAWTGELSTDWSTSGNWKPAVIPPADALVAITESLPRYPVINANVKVENLTIAAGASLTVKPNYVLTITGLITNNNDNSGLILKSDESGDAGLICNTPLTNASVELFLKGGAGTFGPRYHYFASPVKSMEVGTNLAQAKANLGLTHFNSDLLLYDETKANPTREKGWQYFDGYISTTPFSSLTSARAYEIYLSAADRITFKGQLNGEAHSYKLIYTAANPDPGWNLVGNPYPCNYDLNSIEALMTEKDNIDNTVYYTKEGGYIYRNILTNAGVGIDSDIIPPMQGFFVRTTSEGNPLNFPVEGKTILPGMPRAKGTSETSSDKMKDMSKIKLRLSKGSRSDETVVCLLAEATQSFDGDYDAFKLFGFGSVSPYIYSAIAGTKYAINTVNGPESDSLQIPLTVVIKEPGIHNISIPEFENLNGLQVVLKHGSRRTNLAKEAIYSFTANNGTYTDFSLLFYTGTTGTENHS